MSPRQQDVSSTPVELRDEWRTPPWLYEFMRRRYPFDIDLAASPMNALCHRYLTQYDDALSKAWRDCGTHGWLNPPYSGIDPWLDKAIAEAELGFTTVALLPAPNGQARFGTRVFWVASEILFITGRLAFLDAEGREVKGNTSGSVIVVYRAHDLGNTGYSHELRDSMRMTVEPIDEELANAG